MAGGVEVRQVAGERELAEALRIRREVFVEEQRIPAELDDDGEDPGALHVLALDGDTAVGTARLSPQAEPPGFAVLARVAVTPAFRGTGLGRRLVLELERLGAAAGINRIELHPHEYLHDFYADLGYQQVGGEMQVGEHRLIIMEKQL